MLSAPKLMKYIQADGKVVVMLSVCKFQALLFIAVTAASNRTARYLEHATGLHAVRLRHSGVQYR